MRPTAQALAHVAGQTFQSFSGATRCVLEGLSEILPDATLVVAQLDNAEGEYRVIDARQGDLAGLDPGLTLHMGDAPCSHMAADRGPRITGDAAADPVYGKLALTTSLGIRAYAAAPLELPDGSRAGSLAAVSSKPDCFDEEDLDAIVVLARLLAYEWERVRREHDLRRLNERLREQDTDNDPVTGLLRREKFVEMLDREWHLSRRGTVMSYVATVRLEGLADVAQSMRGQGMANLLLKDVGRALMAVRRRADFVARVSDDTFAVALIGCKDDAGLAAFINRLTPAIARATSERPVSVELAHAGHALADSSSAAEALVLAEQDTAATPTAA